MGVLNDERTIPNPDHLRRIKLVVSDLDGTLLNANSQLPADFSQVVRDLADRDILFATASGRNWQSQKAVFTACNEQMTFICDNGAFIVHKGRPFFISELKEDLWKSIARKCAEYGSDCGAVICGVRSAYLLRNPQIQPVVEQFYPEIVYVDDFDEIDDQVFRISVCYLKGPAGEMFDDFSRCYAGQASLVCAHPVFMDVMNSGINKAAGVSMLQQSLGLTSEQTMAFGDYDNDIEMLKNAGIAYIMENAPLSMREHAQYLAPSNEEQGVVTVLEDTLLKAVPV